VLVPTNTTPDGPIVRGHDFGRPDGRGRDLDAIMDAMMTTGFQATTLGQAVEELNRMVRFLPALSRARTTSGLPSLPRQTRRPCAPPPPRQTDFFPPPSSPPQHKQPTVVPLSQPQIHWRLSDDPVPADCDDPQQRDPAWRAEQRAVVYLGYTSNLVSAGTREQIRWLVQHRMVDVLVTTAGGVEEDLIKCVGGTTHLGDWALRGADLRSKGLNRIGNMLVPNANYCAFEDWIMPVLDAMLDEQESGDAAWRASGDAGDRVSWTPSKVIERLGREVRDPSSVYYWAARNGIPVFCPALTDGSIGDMLYFHSYRRPGLKIDLVEDIRRVNDTAMRAAPRRTGMLLLGGGVPKHHVNNANLMRNGADYAVMVNTAQEFDGSDSGAKPDEAVSWGKIRPEARPVKVVADATVIFPLLVAQTFARDFGARARQPLPEAPGYEARPTGDKAAQLAQRRHEEREEGRRQGGAGAGTGAGAGAAATAG